MLPDPLEKNRGVIRVAHGCRGAGHNIRNAVSRTHPGHALEHMDSALHGLLVQAAVQKHALAQTDHMLNLIEHRAGGIDRPHPHQHQAHGVAAQVENAQHLAGLNGGSGGLARSH